MSQPKLAVLVSGEGRILHSILHSSDVKVSLVVADRECPALTEVALGSPYWLPCHMLDRKEIVTDARREAFTRKMVSLLEEHHIGCVAMAGFMTVLSPCMFDTFEGKVLNTHPSLLPAFPGSNAVRDALAYGAKVTGCTMHVATPTLDHGPILRQQVVPIDTDDTVGSLGKRINGFECALYPFVIRTFMQNGVNGYYAN